MSIISRVKSLFGYPDYGVPIPKSWDWGFWQQGRDTQLGVGSDNGTVEACIQTYAQTMAQLRGTHYRINKDGGRERIANSALTRFLRKPNSFMGRSEWMLNLVYQLYSNGNAYAIATRNNRNEIDALYIVPSNFVRPHRIVESGDVFYHIAAREFTFEDVSTIYAQRDVLHVRLNMGFDNLTGQSPISHHAHAILANSAIVEGSSRFFLNQSRPSGVLSTDAPLNKDQIGILREAWNNQSADLNSGKIPVLAGGLKFQPLSMNSQDAELVKAYDMSVREIANAYRIPTPMLNDLSNASYNNTETLVSVWLSQGLGFCIEHIEDIIGNFFDLPHDQELNYDEKVLLRTNFEGRINGLKSAVQGGIQTINEARHELSLSPVEGGDEPLVQSQMIPVSQAIKEPEPMQLPPQPIEPEPEPEPDPAMSAEMIEFYIRKGITA